MAGKGTDRRASSLPNLYKNKLVPVDARFHATLPGQRGPLVRRLESYGRVQGLVVYQGKGEGGQGSDNELRAIIAQIRKYLSSAFCLSRTGQICVPFLFVFH